MKKHLLALSAAAVLLAPNAVGAEGFSINEWSAEGFGMGGARMFAENDAANMAYNPASLTKIKGEVAKLIALSESYPDLKANQNFVDLSRQLVKLEDDIENSRKYYNSVVKMLNNKVEMFPSNVIARWFKFTRKDMFEVTSSAERENVKVQF